MERGTAGFGLITCFLLVETEKVGRQERKRGKEKNKGRRRKRGVGNVKRGIRGWKK